MSTLDEKKPNAIDLSHHLSDLSKARVISPLKKLQKDRRENMIALASGRPDPAYFPFASISADALLPDSFPLTKSGEGSGASSSLFGWLWKLFGSAPSTEKTERFSVPKHATKQGDIDLANALQYSPATGQQALQDLVRDLTSKLYKPGYADWTTLVETGNTDGIHRTLATLCNSGEYLIVEEWAYASVLSTVRPMNITPVGVKLDGQGMIPTDLEHILSTWDEAARGAKRPHVMYTVPIGQNPTGATMGMERKKAIYAICVKYDIIILEDDPYYFLQEGTYHPKDQRSKMPNSRPKPKKGENEITAFLNSLAPSFVRFDYQGRVIRMDSFSKIIAPGSRMGWFTCNPLFAERLEREGESVNQAPNGFSQVLITQLIAHHWRFPSFIRWVQGLQVQYTLRRDFFVDCLFDAFDIIPTTSVHDDNGIDHAILGRGGVPVMVAYGKSAGRSAMSEKGKDKRKPLFSFVPPTSGMFVWLKFHISPSAFPPSEDYKGVEMQLWAELAEHGLLIGPGSSFAAETKTGTGNSTTAEMGKSYSQCGEKKEMVIFRLSFSMGPEETMRKGVEILADVLKKYA